MEKINSAEKSRKKTRFFNSNIVVVRIGIGVNEEKERAKKNHTHKAIVICSAAKQATARYKCLYEYVC